MMEVGCQLDLSEYQLSGLKKHNRTPVSIQEWKSSNKFNINIASKSESARYTQNLHSLDNQGNPLTYTNTHCTQCIFSVDLFQLI